MEMSWNELNLTGFIMLYARLVLDKDNNYQISKI